MKNVIFLIPVLTMMGCTSYKNNVPYATSVPTVTVEPATITPNVTVGNRIGGRAECSNILFVFHHVPSERTYGATLNAQSDVSADSECAAAAVYDALSRSNNADVLIAPKFTSITNSFLCLPWLGCFVKSQDMYVEAYEGKVTYKNN